MKSVQQELVKRRIDRHDATDGTYRPRNETIKGVLPQDETRDFLINTTVPAEGPAIPPLHSFDLDHQLTQWLDYQLDAARAGWGAKEGLDDDSISSICPHFGIAEHSAWIGMEVRLQETTCLPVPVIRVPDDLKFLHYSEKNKWFIYMKSGYEYLRSREEGSFVTSAGRGTMAPMDLANAVRGDELFTDFLLQPDFCHRLMVLMVDAIQWYFPYLYAWADDIAGGRVFTFGKGWMPPQTIGHLSNDAAMLCSPEVYEEFGYPYECRLAKRYKQVFYHIHSEKIHYVQRLATLPKLVMLQVSDDPKTIPPIEDLPRILSRRNRPSQFDVIRKQQSGAENIDELSCRNVFLQVNCIISGRC